MMAHLSEPVHFIENSGHLKMGYTTALGGVNPRWGFNLGYNTLEAQSEVDANRKDFEALLGNNLAFAYAKQIHSADVIPVNAEGSYLDIDGMVSREKNLVLNIQTADCLGILAHDAKNNVIGAFHAGWRGSSEEIAVRGIRAMEELGADRSQIHVQINPGIKLADYEVSEDLKKYFPKEVFETINGKLHLDLEKENIRQLKNFGVGSISSSPLSTFQEPLLYSYRRDQDRAGRFISFICQCGD